jgi:hypothetical protein
MKRMLTLLQNPVTTFLLLVAITTTSCGISRNAYNPDQKYAPEQLRRDYSVFRGVLEESHPSLYWFSPKDSIEKYFERGYSSIKDSMNERQFRSVLNYVVSKLRCGHTSVSHSSRYMQYYDTANFKIFPLSMKVWEDTMVVTANLNRRDSVLSRGTIITSVNGKSTTELIDTFFNYITGDGFSATGRYQTLSNRGNFGALYKTVYGLSDSISVGYIDSNGVAATTVIEAYDPRKDSVGNFSLASIVASRRGQKRIRAYSARNLQIDTSLSSAYMTVNTFSRGHALKKFFRRSFRNIRRLGIQHLVVDVRSNGGGDAGNSTLLTRYLSDHRFRIADSLYAVRRTSRYSQHIRYQPIYWLMMSVVTRKQNDGKYHFGFFERHTFRPKKSNHFSGNVYILTGGNSFSATTLFAQELKGQKNVTIIGEETGGGSYGNTAWMIPEVRLPNTKLRLRIPKFRLVMRKDLVREGRGVQPDIYSAPTAEDIRKGTDVKLETVLRLIKERRDTVLRKN